MEAEDDTEKDNVTEKQDRSPVSGVEEKSDSMSSSYSEISVSESSGQGLVDNDKVLWGSEMAHF